MIYREIVSASVRQAMFVAVVVFLRAEWLRSRGAAI